LLLKFTLVADGSSDKTLLPILEWLCRRHIPRAVEGQWFDPRPFAQRAFSLKDRIIRSLELYPCDILFIHRDAESVSHQERCSEIISTVQSLPELKGKTPYICVVPVRMTEAWLLFDETAIRRAAGNPNGKMKLNLPSIRKADKIQDPKELLFQVLKVASGLNPSRKKRLNLSVCRHRVAEYLNDFSPLRNLDAFRRLEDDITRLPFAI
jgi:hypothetical protein